jgi:hypothetical protein
MARCPYGPHRLSVSGGGYCRRCNGDVRLYAAAQAVPVLMFNDARRRCDERNYAAAASLLESAIALRPAFPAACWLLGAVETARGNFGRARSLLSRARELGAAVDPAWVDEAAVIKGAPETPEAPSEIGPNEPRPRAEVVTALLARLFRSPKDAREEPAPLTPGEEVP